MTQHIKTHFKARGINSLANNPATLTAFLSNNRDRSALSSYIPEDMMNSLQNNQEAFVPEDMDTNRYEGENNLSLNNPNNQSVTSENDTKEETPEDDIDPC